MFKMLGIIASFIACTSLGLLKSWEVKERKKLLIDFKDLMNHISTEISYLKEPLPQVFSHLAAGDDRESKLLLRSCLIAYQSQSLDMGQIWKNAVTEVYRKSSLTKEDLSVMKRCGDFLGQSDFRGQQDHFELLHSQLDRQIDEAEEQIKTKGRMYGKLGISMGMIIAIVFI